MSTALRKLEIGCGDRPTPGYLHQEVHAQDGQTYDFLCPPWEIPLEPGCLSEVLALGVMEHLRYADVHGSLRHFAKLLAPGGELLFDVPDMAVWSEYLYDLLHHPDKALPFTEEHVWSTVYGWQRWPGDEHKSGWSERSIRAAVEGAGLICHITGPEIFQSRGIERGRFTRPGDAHVYVRGVAP